MRGFFSVIILLIIAACNLFGPPAAAVPGTSVVRLTVGMQGGVNTFSRAGEVVTYQYTVMNTGSGQLAGPVIINDGPRQAVCPNVNTIGDLDPYLDLNETITCSAAYTISEADFNAGSITNVATATVGGIISNQSGVTLTRATVTAQPSAALTLAKTSSSQTYGQVGQQIIYTYVITNAGATALGPVQFTISDNKLGAAFNCGPANTTLAASQSINCTATYVITQTDMNSATLTNSATASGAGQTSAAASVTIANLTITQPAPATTAVPPSNLSPGSTISHTVDKGEWLFQIARCYGANIKEVIAANPQIVDPNVILRDQLVTVPRIGSMGRIYGKPCVSYQNAQTNDTWASLGQRYNACVAVLQIANSNRLVAGSPMRIPNNSAALYCPGSSTSPAAPAQPGVTLVPTSSGIVQRITIAAGQDTARQIGVINPNETIRFVIAATQGQVLSVSLTAPANEVNLGVNSPTGIALKPLDATPTWSATVTTSGDHTITLFAALGNSSKSYTLEVKLTGPIVVVPTATPTPTNTPGGT
jgi:LysM repeat protein